ncbi:MAG: YggS family pyridoxal phosphate-dependent enzyme [Robiginitomaculum sp.]|nr:MAG: YggS family pyridoxal phosphate-dependent enzyme [Robiginitomaculum sp.]
MNQTLSEISTKSKQIAAKIEASAKASGRNPHDITLVAVSKRQPMERIDAAWEVGHRVFGENQVPEAEQHWQQKRADGVDVQLHLIGHLQSNKAPRAVELFDVIETLDSLKLAKALDVAMGKTRRSPEILVQVNTGEEPQKHGIFPKDLPTFLEQVAAETQIQVAGLMCLPPQGQEPGLHFALLAKLAARHNLPKLSMGMSSDFETGILFGAHLVRVGSALFGERQSR